MAAVSYVHTLSRVAQTLGIDENLLDDLSLGMDPEAGHLWIYGPGDETISAFTDHGVENLKQRIADLPGK